MTIEQSGVHALLWHARQPAHTSLSRIRIKSAHSITKQAKGTNPLFQQCRYWQRIKKERLQKKKKAAGCRQNACLTVSTWSCCTCCCVPTKTRHKLGTANGRASGVPIEREEGTSQPRHLGHKGPHDIYFIREIYDSDGGSYRDSLMWLVGQKFTYYANFRSLDAGSIFAVLYSASD